LPTSIAPAGSPLKGLNYIKGKEDPLALPEEEYPEWLWRCLDTPTTKGGDGEEAEGDEFCMLTFPIFLNHSYFVQSINTTTDRP
jgi:Mitochondrial ribosomal protein L37